MVKSYGLETFVDTNANRVLQGLIPATSRVQIFSMAAVDHVSNSESSEDEIAHTPERTTFKREPSQPHSVLSHRFRESPQKSHEERSQGRSSEDAIAVMVPAPSKPWEYAPWRGDTTVEAVLEELEGDDGQLGYKIEFEDGRKEDVSQLRYFLDRFTSRFDMSSIYLLLPL